MNTVTQILSPSRARCTIFLAHGAGAGMNTPFMDEVATGLADYRIGTIRFLFPYMERSLREGKKFPPDREPVLCDTWLQVIRQNRRKNFLIGGKSMGGRIAATICNEVNAQGLVCLGYPFHPPGKPEKSRHEILKRVESPTLVLQGERDPFGNQQEVKNYRLRKPIQIAWLPDGDHGFKPRKSSGFTLEENLITAVSKIDQFVTSLGH